MPEIITEGKEEVLADPRVGMKEPVVETPEEPKVEPEAEPEAEPVVPEEVTPEVEPEVESEPEPQEPAKPSGTISRELAQARIDRMYARLQAEREKNNRGSAPAVAPVPPVNTGFAFNDEQREQPTEKTFTAREAENLWREKENEKKFKDNEITVLMRHPNAVTDDGTLNMEDSFARAYAEIGRNNPGLSYMIDGPILAEAAIEKKLNKINPEQEKVHQAKVKGTHTAKSTVSVSATKIVQLTDVQRKVASRMGLTEQQYIEQKNKIDKTRKAR